ncbi:hypothetical protein OAJ83_00565 [Candidatus Nitrosopelagicus sp.]|nr:hypothetical protein [Candidatus Nitrosopelagicus sp.]
MSDNSFQVFYEELKILVEKFEKKQTQIKMESELDYDSVKIFGEKMDSVTRAKLGIDDAAELAYTTAEHHPYWGILYNCTEITKTILEKWNDELTLEQLDEMKWNLKEIQNTISNIENKLKK